ncbi:TIGR03643 family protein [Polynucleobacter necessarius]|uniref:TIGR03643 family protein n=1 Tax=Polynucleobacter necessarius TaxID=576610 RepID=UPI001E55087D|nr:TIGR03643 family protein [Polynucleobacter necessarius]
MPKINPKNLTEPDLSRLIEMAWEDRTPFDVIEKNFGIGEPQVIAIMHTSLKRSSFEWWRKE